jgi:AraC-like DNA-binding protein
MLLSPLHNPANHGVTVLAACFTERVDELARVTSALRRHAREGLTGTPLTGVSLLRASIPTQPLGDVVEPTLGIVAQGTKVSTLNGRSFTYGAGQFLLVSVQLPLVGHVTQASPDEPLLAFVLTLRPEQIASLLLEVGADRPSRADAHRRGIAVSDASPVLLDAVARMLTLLDSPADAAALSAGIEREILWRLITGPQGYVIAQIGLADSRLAHLARAIRHLRTHYDEALRIEDLAAVATMSISSFHRHFRAVTSMTPIQFQKRIRLHEARARLVAGAEDIASIGFAVGYQSPSQFSREYRSLFGLPPSQDASVLRDSARASAATSAGSMTSATAITSS